MLKVHYIFTELFFRSVDVKQIFVAIVMKYWSLSASFVTARKISYWFQSWSNKVCFRPFNNDQKQREIKCLYVWRTFKEFSGFSLHTRYIINVISLVLCQRLLDKFCSDFCNFTILLYSFVYNVKAYIKLTGKLLEPLLIFFKIFDNFRAVLMAFSRPDMSYFFKYSFFPS